MPAGEGPVPPRLKVLEEAALGAAGAGALLDRIAAVEAALGLAAVSVQSPPAAAAPPPSHVAHGTGAAEAKVKQEAEAAAKARADAEAEGRREAAAAAPPARTAPSAEAAAAERERRVREAVARVGPAEAARFGWKENYGWDVSKADGERRRREAMQKAQAAKIKAHATDIKAQYEAARASGAPNDTVRDARDARARTTLRRVRRGERAARARDSDARRSPPPPAERELRSALQGGEGRQDRGRPSLHRYGSQR